jgi:K+-sensing histidine kinase KdpD
VSAVAGSFFFVKPYFTFNSAGVTDVIQFLNFTSVTVISVLVIEKLQRMVYAHEMVLKIMESRYKISLYRENDRIYFSKKNNESWAILEEILVDFEDIILLQFGDGGVKLEPLFMTLTACHPSAMVLETWHTWMHADDAALLLANLEQPVQAAAQVHEMTLRFSSNPQATPHQVVLESFMFLGKPLKILRLANA